MTTKFQTCKFADDTSAATLPTSMKADPKTIDTLRLLHAQYVKDLEDSKITALSLRVYKTNSENFIRWVEGDFTPGKKKRKSESQS